MAQAEMNPTLAREYNRILGDLVNVITDEQLPLILALVERIPDDCADLHATFEADRKSLERIRLWRDPLRLLRLSIGLKQSLSAEYDNFVNAYQQLSARAGGGADERKLLEEIGALMYRIDDLSGEHERLANRAITQISRSMKDVYGIMMEPDESVFQNPAPENQLFRLGPIVREMLEVCGQLNEQIRIMQALIRIRRLILKF